MVPKQISLWDNEALETGYRCMAQLKFGEAMILYEAEIVSQERLQSLLNEYEEVVKIVNTVRHNRKKK